LRHDYHTKQSIYPDYASTLGFGNIEIHMEGFHLPSQETGPTRTDDAQERQIWTSTFQGWTAPSEAGVFPRFAGIGFGIPEAKIADLHLAIGDRVEIITDPQDGVQKIVEIRKI
jgi:hypothetical protein